MGYSCPTIGPDCSIEIEGEIYVRKSKNKEKKSTVITVIGEIISWLPEILMYIPRLIIRLIKSIF